MTNAFDPANDPINFVPEHQDAEDTLEEHEEDDWEESYDPIAERKEQRRRKTMTIVSYVVTLAIGLGVGVFYTRWRYHQMKAIVSINGEVINEDAFVHRMEVAAGRQVLQRMANEMLQDQYARKLGVTVTPAEVTARYKQVAAKSDFPQLLANTHESPEDVANNIRLELTVNKIVGKQVSVTDQDIQNYYKQQIDKKNPQARFYTPPRVTIQVITSRNKEHVMQAKEELDKGLDFTAAAARYSDDLTSKDHGGDLPPIVRGRTIYSQIKGLEETIFDMKVGEQRGPMDFHGARGTLWAIIRCLKQEPETTIPYDQVVYECRTGALMSKLPPATAKQIRDAYNKFQMEATIHTFRPEYKMVFGGR